MMDTIQLMDVTLRDGGNRNDFHFSLDDIQHILSPLDKAGIDYVEVGYRNGAARPLPGAGCAGVCEQDYLRFCRRLLKKAHLVVMAHAEKLQKHDVLELKSCGVDLLRLCLTRQPYDKHVLQQVVLWCEQVDLRLSLNLMHISQYAPDELDKAIEYVVSLNPAVVYFADSNGSLLPHRVKAIYEQYTQVYSIPFGFHAHDNLGLAQMNAITACSAGASYIDAALSGMGKGIGNLRTEFFVAYLKAIHHERYLLDELLPATNYVRKTFSTEAEKMALDEFLRGIMDFSSR